MKETNELVFFALQSAAFGITFLLTVLHLLVWFFKKKNIYLISTIYLLVWLLSYGIKSEMFMIATGQNSTTYFRLAEWSLLIALVGMSVVSVYYTTRNQKKVAILMVSCSFFAGVYLAFYYSAGFRLDPLLVILSVLMCSLAVALILKREILEESKTEQLPQKLDITSRESEVWALLSEGFTDKEIADKLNRSVPTVKTYIRSLYKKLNVKNRTEATLLYNRTNNP